MEKTSFEEFLTKFRYPLLILLGGLLFIGVGILFFKTGFNFGGEKIEILNDKTSSVSGQIRSGDLTAEIAGAVVKPGVYKLGSGARIDDLLVMAGGFSGGADRVWTDKYLNRAAKLTDGQKLYVPKIGEQTNVLSAKTSGGDQSVSSTNSTDSSGLININTAGTSDLDSLPGIGPVYAQNIIEHRPYSTTQELVSKGAIKQSLYDKIKDKVTVY